MSGYFVQGPRVPCFVTDQLHDNCSGKSEAKKILQLHSGIDDISYREISTAEVQSAIRQMRAKGAAGQMISHLFF